MTKHISGTIELTNTVPMPAFRGRPATYPYRIMQVGDSFFIARPYLNTSHWAQKTGFVYQTAKCTESGIKGIRVFRIQ